MRKILIILFIFFISGCSIDGLVVWGEINKVQVVKRSTYVKHYRAYFQRTHLRPVRHGKKYLYFYNSRTKDLAILLHPKNKYLLYSFSQPNLVIKIRSNKKNGYRHMMKVLKRKGYRVASPHSVGYTASVSLRRYKKVKTLFVEVKDYQHLLHLYKKAIRTYNAKGIRKIRTRLPKSLIEGYYKKYKAQATTETQRKQLEIIASKLHMNTSTEREEETSHTGETAVSPAIDNTEDNTKRLYDYYLNKASYYELNNYLSTAEAKNTLTPSQYKILNNRNTTLAEKKLLQDGSLEELITAYKKNRDPRYKSLIMERIEEIQKNR